MTLPVGGSPTKGKGQTKTARKVELASQGVAGGVGSAFGAAKLRDTYKTDKPGNPAKFNRATMKVAQRSVKMGVKPATAGKVLHSVRVGHPSFKVLATAVGAGTLATGAHRYQEAARYFREKRKSSPLAKSEPRRTGPAVRLGIPAHLPQHTVKPYIGRRRKLTRVDNVHARLIEHSPRLAQAAEAIADFAKAACCTGELGNLPRTAHMAGIGKVRVIGYHGDGKLHVIDSSDSARIVHRDKLNFHRQKGSGMSKSAFGVEHVSKADNGYKPNKAPSTGRQVAGTTFGVYHSAVAGKKGRKLGAVGSTAGHQLGGAALGAAAGTALTRGRLRPVAAGGGYAAGVFAGNHRAVVTNSQKGRYKAEKPKTEVGKSAYSAVSNTAARIGRAGSRAVDTPRAVRSGYRMGASQRKTGAKSLQGQHLDSAMRHPDAAYRGFKVSAVNSTRNRAVAGGTALAAGGAAGGATLESRRRSSVGKSAFGVAHLGLS